MSVSQKILPFNPPLICAPEGFHTKKPVGLDIAEADNLTISAINSNDEAAQIAKTLSKTELGILDHTPALIAPISSDENDDLRNYIAAMISTGSVDLEHLSSLLPERLKDRDPQIIAKTILTYALFSPQNQKVGMKLEFKRGEGLINLLNALKKVAWQTVS